MRQMHFVDSYAFNKMSSVCFWTYSDADAYTAQIWCKCLWLINQLQLQVVKFHTYLNINTNTTIYSQSCWTNKKMYQITYRQKLNYASLVISILGWQCNAKHLTDSTGINKNCSHATNQSTHCRWLHQFPLNQLLHISCILSTISTTAGAQVATITIIWQHTDHITVHETDCLTKFYGKVW